MTSMSDPLVGRVLDGRYEILARLARGGMATVYRAQDHRLTRTVAVKVMHDGLGDDAEFARKFDREARAAAHLSNPHVVSVFDQGIDNGRPYIVMEFVQGCTLRHIITREAPLPPLRVLDLMEPVVSALSSAHESGMVHRDVKPENVLISDRGQIKVADFGLARAVTGQTATATQGLLIGTVSYLPPELVTSGRADARSDVYSAGVVLFELLTGKKPHTGDTPIQVAYSHVHNDIPAPSTLLAGNDPRSMDSRRIIPPYLDALVLACTRRQPSERPTDGRELLHLLRTARKALSHGILDDPALTAQMGASMQQGFDALEPTQPQSPAELLGATAEALDAEPDAPARPSRWQPRNAGGVRQVPAQTPMSPVDWSPTAAASARSAFTAQSATSALTGPVPAAAPRWRESPADARRRVIRRRRSLVALLLVLLLTAGIGGGSYWWFSSGQYTSAPAITGSTRAQAEEVASANALGTNVVEQFSESVPKGTVISTNPTAGERIRRHGTLTVYVSKGKERYAVPKLIGLQLEDAKKALGKANLGVGQVTETWSEDVAAGVVITTSQKLGDLLKKGVPVDLQVSKGRQPIDIPDYTDKRATAATKDLEAKGFKVASSEQNHDEVEAGRIISQTPNQGTGHKGDAITLVVSKGPVMVEVPKVGGMTEQAATAQLTAAGFQVKVVHATADWLRLDTVRAASPAQGKTAKKGSTVTIWVI